MSTTTPDMRASSMGVKRGLARLLALLVALAIAAYGLMTIQTAIVYHEGAGNPQVLARNLALREASEAGKLTESYRDIAGYASAYVALLGMVSSPLHAFAKGSLGEHALVYGVMPKANGAVLAGHILFGSFCLIFGALQFWPSFRQRHPKWHRAVGGTYIVTVQASMVLAIVYLLRTPAADVIDQLFFATGLWSLAITVTISLWMAVYSLKKKQIAQHQAWMCINFGLLLSTPMQRFGWLAFGAISPDSRFMESNYAVSGALVPFAIMVSYAMFLVTRRQQARRSASSMARLDQALQVQSKLGRLIAWSLLPLLPLAAGLTVYHYAFGLGFSSALHAAQLIPASVIANHDQVVSGSMLPRTVFVLATLLGLWSGGRFLWSAFIQGDGNSARAQGQIRGAWGLVVAGLGVGAALLSWGIQLGMPSYATLAGGTLSVFGGAIALLFSSALALALRRGEVGWVKEWGTFVLTCVLATTNFYLTLPAIELLGFDAQFVSTGHVFRLAETSQWFVLLFPFIYAAYGQATQERVAR